MLTLGFVKVSSGYVKSVDKNNTLEINSKDGILYHL